MLFAIWVVCAVKVIDCATHFSHDGCHDVYGSIHALSRIRAETAITSKVSGYSLSIWVIPLVGFGFLVNKFSRRHLYVLTCSACQILPSI